MVKKTVFALHNSVLLKIKHFSGGSKDYSLLFCFSPHPYLFFNSDKFTFTFLGFNIDRGTGNLVDHQTRNVLETGIMKQPLYDALIRNKVPLNENFDSLPRFEFL